MHPPSRHKRSQSSKDLDDAVSKLEHARDVLLDAKVKTNEALSKAALTLWQRECRRPPRTFTPDQSLTGLIIRSRSNSPTCASQKNASHHTTRTLTISEVRSQAHITHQSVVYSPKLKRLEINQTHSTTTPLDRQLENSNPDLTQSIEHKIRRRHKPRSKSHQQLRSLHSSANTLNTNFDSETSQVSETLDFFKDCNVRDCNVRDCNVEDCNVKDCTLLESHKAASSSDSNSSISTSSKSSDRKSTLSDIRAMLQNLQEQLYYVPGANVKSIKQDLADGSLPSHASGAKQSELVRGDLCHLEANTRDVLRALTRRYKR